VEQVPGSVVPALIGAVEVLELMSNAAGNSEFKIAAAVVADPSHFSNPVPLVGAIKCDLQADPTYTRLDKSVVS
jgi:hypothetical protein